MLKRRKVLPMNRRILILGAMTAAVAGVLSIKHFRRPDDVSLNRGPAQQVPRPGLYLFFDDRDHDAGCEGVYAAFEKAKAGLPAGFESARFDIQREPARAENLGVRMLPTILLIRPDGTVAARIEGEGDEVYGKLRELISRLSKRP